MTQINAAFIALIRSCTNTYPRTISAVHSLNAIVLRCAFYSCIPYIRAYWLDENTLPTFIRWPASWTSGLLPIQLWHTRSTYFAGNVASVDLLQHLPLGTMCTSPQHTISHSHPAAHIYSLLKY